ncbi:hypothetical protein NE237_027705 [Protea cynaroides]|uniref:Uncharacterized protein n=1 Tax=Protea cynaroides TaxID=273540 RepID=A0A9Q0GQN4_9MAGN|nr:hypothetical protein NE237_027705 [Protea cynaroides]
MSPSTSYSLYWLKWWINSLASSMSSSDVAYQLLEGICLPRDQAYYDKVSSKELRKMKEKELYQRNRDVDLERRLDSAEKKRDEAIKVGTEISKRGPLSDSKGSGLISDGLQTKKRKEKLPKLGGNYVALSSSILMQQPQTLFPVVDEVFGSHRRLFFCFVFTDWSRPNFRLQDGDRLDSVFPDGSGPDNSFLGYWNPSLRSEYSWGYFFDARVTGQSGRGTNPRYPGSSELECPILAKLDSEGLG